MRESVVYGRQMQLLLRNWVEVAAYLGSSRGIVIGVIATGGLDRGEGISVLACRYQLPWPTARNRISLRPRFKETQSVRTNPEASGT